MGWAQGLQSGMALGNLINQGFDRRELAEEAKKHQIDETIQPDKQEAVSGLVAQRDARAQELISGGADANTAYQQATQDLLPQFQETSKAAGLSTQYGYGGQTYADRGEAERALAVGRTQGLANVYRAQGNEEQASALESRAMQNRAAALQVKGLERTDKEATAMQAFETDFNQLEDKTNMDAVKQLAAKHNLNRSQQFTVASQMSGIEKADLEMMDTYIKKATKGKDLDGLLDLHKNDKKFADGTHFIKAVGKDGQVILNLVSDADPTKVLRTEAFKNSDLATAYLRKQAEDPGMVAEWTLGVQKLQAQIAAADASTAKDRALGGYYAGGGSSGLKGVKAQVAAFKDLMGRDPTDKEKSQMLGLVTKDSSKPEFNPKDYAASIKSFTDAGLSLPAATIRADELYGRLAPVADEDGALAALNDKKGGKGKANVENTAPAVALEQKFIREKNNRGAYTYTASPRGLTRAQYAEIDRNK